MRRLILILSALAIAVGAGAADWNMEFIGDELYSGVYYDLHVSGNYLWTAAKRGVEVYDISDPRAPVFVSTLRTPGLANGVFFKDDILYVGDVYGFVTIDASDPANLHQLGMYSPGDDGGYPERVRVRGNYAYVAAYDAGLQVFDVSEPASPQLIGEGAIEGFAWYVAISGNRAYLAATFSIEAFDISDPANPIHLASIPKMFCFGLEADGNALYVSYIDGFDILDVSDPANPTVIGTSGITGGNSAEAVALQNNIAYVAHGNYIDIIDYSVPTAPSQIGYYFTRAHPRGLAAHGTVLYVIEDARGIEVIDIADPAKPQFIVMLQPFNTPNFQNILLQGDRLYVAQGIEGVRIYDVSTPESPVQLGLLNTPGTAQNVAVQGNLMFVGDSATLVIGDITDPAAPVVLSSYRTTGNPWAATADGSYVYMTDIYGIHAFDITDPAAPNRLSVLFTNHSGAPYGIVKHGNHLFVAASHGGLWVVDASNPSRLRKLAQIPDDNSKSYYDVAIVGAVAYLMTGSSKIDLYDITNPAAPTFLSTLELSGSLASLHVCGTKMFVAANTTGLFVLDVSSPSAPVIIAGADTSGYCSGAAIADDIVFMSDYYSFARYRLIETPLDTTAPDVAIHEPPANASVEGRTVLVSGAASDAESGVSRVEFSGDGGTSWAPASGAENWRYVWVPDDEGLLRILARATDRAGNTSVPIQRDFNFAAFRPIIIAAGIWDSRLGQSPSTLNIAALVTDPESTDFLDELQVLVGGQPVDVGVEPVVQDVENFRLYLLPLPWPGSGGMGGVYPFGLRVTDTAGRFSIAWPYLIVK